jgi:hypothetical protein
MSVMNPAVEECLSSQGAVNLELKTPAGQVQISGLKYVLAALKTP